MEDYRRQLAWTGASCELSVYTELLVNVSDSLEVIRIDPFLVKALLSSAVSYPSQGKKSEAASF